VSVLRDGREEKLKVSLAELPARARAESEGDQGSGQPGEGSGRAGLTLQVLTPDIASRLGLGPNEQGLVVTGVDPAGAGSDAGILQGDVIQEVNKQRVRNAKDLVAVSKKLKPNEKILIRVYSQGRSGYVALEPK